MSLLEKTKQKLRRHRIFPNRLLGQNFMVESSIFEPMTNYASLSQRDVVLDIGAGLGFLTHFLASKCGSVLAVEADPRLVRVLREEFEDLPNVKIIEGDVLKVEAPEFNKVVSVPPYHISSRLLLWILHKNLDCAISIFQKEFADRLVAPVGSEDYGWLTVVAYCHVEVELLDDVPKWMFFPQPEVDSIIVRLKPKKPLPFTLNNEVFFQRLVRSLFTQRNRKARNAILSFLKGMRGTSVENTAKMVEALPFLDRRIRELAPEDFGAIANALIK